MNEQRHSGHTVTRFTAHLVWVTKYRYPALKKRYWGWHFWAIDYGGWSTGNVTDELVQEYLEHHRNPSNKDNGNLILE